MNRRQFLRASTASAAAAIALGRTSFSPAADPLGANDDLRVAVIGFHDHGRSHIRAYKAMKGVRLVALCDVDEQVLETQAAELEKEGIRVKKYRDLRALYDSREIDAVSIVTPNHWHALATVWACQAGKDVCVEKPISHSISEGRKMVEAARKYNRMVQADIDSRSRLELEPAFEYVQSGAIGKIVYVRAFDYKRRPSIGRSIGPQKIPDGIDYNLWTGPAPMRPLMRQKFHYDWHWQWPTGNGEIANNGSHQLDQVRRAIGKHAPPTHVQSFGGRYGYVDDGQIPNTLVAVYDYDGIPVIYEARGLPENSQSENMDGFRGRTATGKEVVHPHDAKAPNDGYVVFCEGGYYCRGAVYDNDGKEVKRFSDVASKGPQENFIVGVRSRKLEDLKTDILEGHITATFCHLGNVSYQCGESIPLAAAKDAVVNNQYAEEALTRFSKHLEANGIDVQKEQVVVGPKLTMDAGQERLTGPHSELANQFLRDTYREPFVIPEKV